MKMIDEAFDDLATAHRASYTKRCVSEGTCVTGPGSGPDLCMGSDPNRADHRSW